MANPINDEERDEIEDYSTIEETYNKGNEITLSYKNLSLLYRLKNNTNSDVIDIPIDNVIYDYLPELHRVAMKVELSDEEYNKYIYRPDLLSYDLYGTTTYEFVILALNNIISPKYFTKRVLNLIDSEFLEEVITDIYNAEQQLLTYNRSSYDAEVGIINDDSLELEIGLRQG